MAVIINNESIVPFFGERMTFVRGLDPLGLQNASDAAFTFLLPGLNNVTGRIRYYSFYCWLLDKYSSEVGSTNPKEQLKFIRRAEYIIALLAQYIEGDRGSIPGSNYTNIEVNHRNVINHDLQNATYKPDGSTRDTYWNYSAGAFGQYYLGSLRDIGIVSEREQQIGLYVRTSKRDEDHVSGEELAIAFGKNISPKNQKIFLEAIKNGRINENDLKKLVHDFNPTQIPNNTDEQNLLKKMLFQKDFPLRIEEKPKRMRNSTIKLLLSFLNDYNKPDFADRIFVYDCYSSQGNYNGKAYQCMIGWYYYQFNEYWQYACTSILNGTLSYLEQKSGDSWMPLAKLVSEVTEEIINRFRKFGVFTSTDESVNDFLAHFGNDPDDYAYFEDCWQSRTAEKVTNAFLLIFSIYVNNNKQIANLKAFTELNEITRDGDVTRYFYHQFEVHKTKKLKDFIYQFIFTQIIYRHQYVAFRKMGAGSLTTQKFIIEDHLIRYIGNFEPSYTGPRIARLVSFLKDLNIITPQHSLSDDGMKILEKLSAEDDSTT